MHVGYYESPVGWIKVEADDKIRGVTFVTKKGQEDRNDVVDACIKQLDEYFAGERKTFDLPLQASGTSFQASVWGGLQTIPFGETRTYGQLAEQVQNPKAVRAVGGANGKNPISLIIPCHRVVASDGMGGFSGGVEKKKWLLDHEQQSYKHD